MKKLFTALAAVALLAGCGGGGGGNTSTGGTYFTHAQLAQDFVYRLEVDLGYDVDLVKTNTLQYNYIVVYDWDYDSYDAYDLTWYNPGENIRNYVTNKSAWFDFDLSAGTTAGTYYSWTTGKTYEQNAAIAKNREAVAGQRLAVVAERAALRLMSFGLNKTDARKAAKGIMYFVTTKPELMSKEGMDRSSKLFLNGHTFSELLEAGKSGDVSAINKIKADVASSWNISQEQQGSLVDYITTGKLAK